MKKILLFVLVVSAAISCDYVSGSGNIITQTRNTGNFTAVSAGGGFEVEIITGGETKVVVEADDNVIDDVVTTVNNGQLKISMQNGVSYNNLHLKVFITAPEINKINASAASEVEVKNGLSSDNTISLHASSGSSITTSVNAPDTDADASSGGQIEVRGRTKIFSVKASSGASVDASELLSENTIAETSSGGSTDVHASIKLDANASSGGNIDYRGAATATIKESSGGSVEKKN